MGLSNRVLLKTLVALAFQAAIVSACACSAYATFPGVNGPIAFVEPGTAGGIVMMNADGSARRTLVRDAVPGGYAWSVAFSADGTRIASSEGQYSAEMIVVANADGSDQRVLTSGISASEPVFSPDGETVMFTNFRGRGRSDIWTIGSDGRDLRRLTTTGRDYSPVFSPDGRTIVFVHQVRVNARKAGCQTGGVASKLYVMDVNGGNRRALSRACGSDYEPSFAPDGRRILFTRSGDYNNGRDAGDLHVMGADGRRVHRLTRGRANDDAASFSPDGRQIVFQRSTVRKLPDREIYRRPGIWVMPARGGDARRLAPYGRRPDWSVASPAT